MKAIAANEMRAIDGGVQFYCEGCYNPAHGYVVVSGFEKLNHKWWHAKNGTYCKFIKIKNDFKTLVTSVKAQFFKS